MVIEEDVDVGHLEEANEVIVAVSPDLTFFSLSGF